MGRNAPRRDYGKTRAAVAEVAAERIQILLDHAKSVAINDETLSRRYVGLARKISQRTKVKIPRDSKKYLCKECGIALIPSKNAKVRLHAHRTGIVITCLSCGAVKRYPVTPRKPAENERGAMKPYIAQSEQSPKKNSSKE